MDKLCDYCVTTCPLLGWETRCLHEPQFADILYEIDYVLNGKYGDIDSVSHTEIISKFTEFALNHLLQPNFCTTKITLYALHLTRERIDELKCFNSLEYRLLNITMNILLIRLNGTRM